MIKKKSLFLSIFCLMILSLLINGNILLTYAATIDKNPPKLISFNISDNTVKPGEYLNLNVKAEDDVSGIDSASIGLYSLMKGYVVYQLQVEVGDSYKVLIPEDAIGGEYIVAFLSFEDAKGNYISYYSTYVYPNDENPFDFGDHVIKVESSINFGEDENAPIVSNITVNKNKITLGEEIKVCAKVKDESKIDYVSIEFGLRSELLATINEEMIYDEESDSYCAFLKPNKTGQNIVANIWATDVYDNSRGYFSKDYTELLNIPELYEKVDMPVVDVKGPKNDIVPPTLSSVKINKLEVVAPGDLKIFVDASDNSGDISYVFASFVSEKQYKKNSEEANPILSNDGEVRVTLTYDYLVGRFVGTIDLDQYTDSGKYYLQYVLLVDSTDNSSKYVTSYFPDDGSGTYVGALRKIEKIDDLSFEIKEEFAYDAVTSTINPNMVSIIRNQKDDAVIMIDATNDSVISEDVFEAIKGTNKTIYLELDGYQWVFNGKDITNIKSIDARVYSELLVDYNVNNKYQEYISIVFADNGILPGKAKIRVKTDYTFRYIEGYEDLKLYYFNPSEEKYKEMDNKIVLTDDGFYEFEITHNSKYVMSNKGFEEELLTVNDDILEKEENKKIEDIEKDTTNTYIIVTFIIVTVVVIIAIIIMLIIKKRVSKTSENNKSVEKNL